MTPAELERWVAEVVCEWYHDDYQWFDSNNEEVGFSFEIYEHYKDPWHPTTDIAQAFLAVEKMREKGWTFLIECFADGEWNAVFAQSGLIKSGQNPNPTTAICKAMRAALTNAKEEQK